MKNLTLLMCTAVTVAMVAPVRAETPAEPVRASIEKALNASAAAWMAGDLDTFMQLYENAPTTRYINSSGVTEGYEAIKAKYAPRFKKGADMGKLSLQVIDAKELGAQYAFVVGRYTLHQADGSTATGITTLLFHKQGGRWLIANDHTS